jgi:hypothetical protein
MRSVNYYLGIGYEVWKGHNAWLWLVVSPNCNAGTIGVAASQDQAARDACLSIEEMTAWPCQFAAASVWANGSAMPSYSYRPSGLRFLVSAEQNRRR